MLALSSGQPCIVHGVGGLKDTIAHDVNGFVFEGHNIESQLKGLEAAFNGALDKYIHAPKAWQSMVKAAKSARFSWQQSISQYIDRLYA